MSLAARRVVMACFCAGLLAAVGCAGGPTGPGARTALSGSATTASSTLASSESPRSGDLHVTKPGNNLAFGHCRLNLATGVGLCTFSGGTGKFTHFHGSANVSQPDSKSPLYAWDGTYSFSPHD